MYVCVIGCVINSVIASVKAVGADEWHILAVTGKKIIHPVQVYSSNSLCCYHKLIFKSFLFFT